MRGKIHFAILIGGYKWGGDQEICGQAGTDTPRYSIMIQQDVSADAVPFCGSIPVFGYGHFNFQP